MKFKLSHQFNNHEKRQILVEAKDEVEVRKLIREKRLLGQRNPDRVTIEPEYKPKREI